VRWGSDGEYKEEFNIDEVIKDLKEYKMEAYIPIFKECFSIEP
jgi:hypothetical protein